jgi:hypothetical protein
MDEANLLNWACNHNDDGDDDNDDNNDDDDNDDTGDNSDDDDNDDNDEDSGVKFSNLMYEANLLNWAGKP